jgi:hypothetical protein
MICIQSTEALRDLPHGSSQARVQEQVGLQEQGKRLVTEALLQHENRVLWHGMVKVGGFARMVFLKYLTS